MQASEELSFPSSNADRARPILHLKMKHRRSPLALRKYENGGIKRQGKNWREKNESAVQVEMGSNGNVVVGHKESVAGEKQLYLVVVQLAASCLRGYLAALYVVVLARVLGEEILFA